MSEFDDRLRQLEDRAAIEDLVVRYFLAADGDDVGTLRALFAPDASFSVSGQAGGAGCEGVIAFLVEQRRNMGLTVHTPHYVLIGNRTDGRAEGIVGAHLELVLGGQSLFGAVRYQDEYVRLDGRWMIARRDMRTIHIAPWQDIDAAFRSERPVRWPGTDPRPSDFPRRGD
ncbi:nuclear transport factor 2 family protein [Sphingomonas sp. C8-2]|jgi:hypothetical protein|nr:nuclear transport factor 2 family protein [Sphingomonas sp. C8-2]